MNIRINIRTISIEWYSKWKRYWKPFIIRGYYTNIFRFLKWRIVWK